MESSSSVTPSLSITNANMAGEREGGRERGGERERGERERGGERGGGEKEVESKRERDHFLISPCPYTS